MLRVPGLVVARCGVAALAFAASPCVAAAQSAAGGSSPVPLKAVGHEPGWTLDIGSDRMTLVTDYGKTRVVVPLPPPSRIDGGRRYEARTEAHTLVATVLDQPCADAMTGMPRPQTVEVVIDGRTLKGCAGDVTAVLRGAPWIVEDIDGRGLRDASRQLTLGFEANGRVQGSTGCNRYVASYVLTGESLTVTMPISTMRACAQPLMEQERRFLDVLRGVQRFELDVAGALVLHAADGGTIRARRVSPPRP